MKIALVGNQNSGKTTLFNRLTGLNQKVGNWAGVTIEKKSGTLKGSQHEIVDTPGVYSLNAYTLEEQVTHSFIESNECEMIINIVDATSIERGLYLTTQLLEHNKKVVVALNMADIAAKRGTEIDCEKLSNSLGVSVVKISAYKNIGMKELLMAIENAEIRSEQFIDCIREAKDNEEVAVIRYDFIEKIVEESIKVKKTITITEKIDKVILNRWLALPIFAVIMFLVYFLSVGIVGGLTVDLVGGLFESAGAGLSNWLISIGASGWTVSLLVDGILAGVGAVLAFVPQLIILFLLITLLETTGYMSRIAFTFDILFKKLGLSGKSLIPFIIGIGCSVPAIMSTRTIENKDERIRTVVMTPFVPCSAKLPIIALFSGFFFGNNAGLVSASLYFFSIIVIIISALLMKKFVFKNSSGTFISELPDYKMPSFSYVLKEVWDKVFAFIKKAGTIILLSSVVIWFLLSFSIKFEYGVDIQDSMLALIGKGLSWLFYPMLGTFSWEATVSAIQGLVAKEQVVSSMAIIAGLGSDMTEGILGSGVFAFFTSASAYAFMVFNLFSSPCFGAIAAMKKELGSTRKLLLAVTFQTTLALILSYIVYGVGLLIGG